MRNTWRIEKERRNVREHGLDVSLAAQVFADPPAETVWDRVVDGEERWRPFGGVAMGGRFVIVVVVHAYPDPDGETRVPVIGLRAANRA